MGISIDLTNTERRVSTAEFALRMNISEKELFLESEIKEFKFSEQGRSFNDKKNVILSDPKSPFKK